MWTVVCVVVCCFYLCTCVVLVLLVYSCAFFLCFFFFFYVTATTTTYTYSLHVPLAISYGDVLDYQGCSFGVFCLHAFGARRLGGRTDPRLPPRFILLAALSTATKEIPISHNYIHATRINRINRIKTQD